MPNLNTLLSPKSIAIVGASNNSQKVGGIVLQNLQKEYTGKIYPINPKETKIGEHACYTSILDLPEAPDLIIFAVPAEITLNLLPQAGDKGCKNILVFSAGFKEMGESGQSSEKVLQEICKKHNFNLIGPNCLGFTNTELKLNATFGKTSLLPGNLNLISQSGAIATALYDWADSRSLGTNYTITIGNKSILNENHFLEFLSTKKAQTQPGLSDLNPISIYIESVADGKELLNIATKACEQNPVVILKPGRTQAAATAMASHTGSLAGNFQVFSQLVSSAGFILAESTEEFFNLSLALSWENTPKGNQIAVISNAGGPAVIAADSINSSSLKLAEISPESQNILAKALPRSASFHNPIDVLGDALAERFESALNTVLNQNNINAVLVIVTPQIMTEMAKTAQIIKTASAKFQKPIYCSFFGGNQAKEAQSILDQAKIPNFNHPESAIRTLSQVWNWQNWRQNKSRSENTFSMLQIPNETAYFLKTYPENKNLLDTNSTTQIFANLGLPTPKSIVTSKLEAAEEFVNHINWPIVIKNVDAGRLHKSDDGGVVTNIYSFVELKRSWHTINPSNSSSIQVQERLNIDYELILGLKTDPNFGPILNLGLGGKLANLIKDVNIVSLPASQNDIEESLAKSHFSQLFTGYRDCPELNFHELAKYIHILHSLFTQFPQISEIEINPIIVNKDGLWFVDPKILLF